MSDDDANERHRIDAAKALDALADPGPQAVPPAEHFHIVIDLSGDSKLKDPNDILVIDATKTPAAIANKTEDEWK